jgi:hypothetical protein
LQHLFYEYSAILEIKIYLLIFFRCGDYHTYDGLAKIISALEIKKGRLESLPLLDWLII